MGKYFGTDGFRGEAGVTLTANHAYKVGRFLGWYYNALRECHGDADRCLCVDEKGNVITGEHILYIYGCYMKERGKLLTNTVVTTVMSNFGL